MSNFTDQFGATAAQPLAAFKVQGQLANGGTATGTKGHGVLDWIPALAGTLGAIGGGVAGTAVAPGVGTAVGGVGGAAAGQTAGKAIENFLTGDKTTAGDLAKEAAIGGGSQLAGGIIGKVGGAVLGKAASGLGNAGDSFISKATFGGATKAAQQTNKATSTIRDLQNLGVRPQAVAQAIPVVTGDNGVVNKGVRTALTQTNNPVNLKEAFPLAGRIADGLDVTKSPGAGAAFRTDFNNIANQMIQKNQPITKVGANTAFDMMKTLESKAFAKGVSPDVRSAYLDVANHIGDQLTAAGADKAVVNGVFQPSDIAALSSISPKLAEAAQSAKTVGDLRSLQAPFVRSNKLLQDAATQSEATGAGTALPGGIPANAAAAVLTHGASLPVTAASAALKSAGGQSFIGKALNGASGALDGSGTIPALINKVAGTAIGTGVRGAADMATNGTLMGPGAAPATSNDTTGADSALTPPATGIGTTGNEPIDFNAEARKILASGADAKTQAAQLDLLSKYQSIYETANKPAAQSAADKKTVSDIQDAFSFLDTAEQQINDLGGAQGPVNELAKIPGIGQYIEPKVAAYNQTRVDLATALAKALTGSARPAASVIARFEQSLPQPTDAPDKASQKLTNLRTELGNKAQNYGLDATGAPVSQ